MKPCPYCGGSERSLRIADGTQSSSVSTTGKRIENKRVKCICGAEGPPALGAEASDLAAVLLWNRRA
jgi:hypothetical protein